MKKLKCLNKYVFYNENMKKLKLVENIIKEWKQIGIIKVIILLESEEK